MADEFVQPPVIRTRTTKRRSHSVVPRIMVVGIFAALLVVAGLLATIASNSLRRNPDVAMPSYQVLEERTVDTPIKAELAFDLLVWGAISGPGLEQLLESLHAKASNRAGFKYYTRPSNVWIYAYTDRERASNRNGQWIAMLRRVGLDGIPEIDINRYELNGLAVPPETKFGLSEQKRRELYKEAMAEHFRAFHEANEQYPPRPEVALKVGDHFTLTETTPLCSSFPDGGKRSVAEIWALIDAIKQLPAGTIIKIRTVRPTKLMPWYEVTATSRNGNLIGNGWINSVAMMGQAEAQAKTNWDLASEADSALKEKYATEFLQRHHLTKEQWSEVESEALAEDWTIPRASRSRP